MISQWWCGVRIRRCRHCEERVCQGCLTAEGTVWVRVVRAVDFGGDIDDGMLEMASTSVVV